MEKNKKIEAPVMSQASTAYYTITASSEFREKERLRAKARRDEVQELYNAITIISTMTFVILMFRELERNY